MNCVENHFHSLQTSQDILTQFIEKFKYNSCEKSFSYAGALKRHVNAIHRCQTNEKQVKEANENRISTIHPKKFKCNSCGNHFHMLEL